MTFLFPVRIQQGAATTESRPPPAPAPARVSMFRRLMVRVTPAERLAADGKEIREKEESPPPAAAALEAEAGSVGLDKMVLSFMEDAAVERPPRGRCGNCFNGNQQDDSDDEDFGFLPSPSTPAAPPAAAGAALELLKGLVQCASTAERDLLADASRIAGAGGRGGFGRKKADVRRAVADGLRALGYDAAVCVSRWDNAASHPAGEHEYIDAVVAEGRLVVEVGFRSEFEVARPTKAYRAALQALPPVFVGTPERLGRVVALVADAARQSLRKRGLHFPPWRKPEYMRAKWLAPHARAGGPDTPAPPAPALAAPVAAAASLPGEFQLRFDEKPKALDSTAGDENKVTLVVSPSPWRTEEPAPSEQSPSPAPPAHAKGKEVTGLASVL